MTLRNLGISLKASDGTGLPVIEEKDRFRHLYVVGKTQTGKSTFFLNLIKQELKDAIIVLDPAGTFAEEVKELSPKDRTIYVDKKNPIVINPLKRKDLSWAENAKEFAEVMNACIIGTTSSPETTVLMNEIILNAIRVFNEKQKDIEYLSNFLNFINVRFAHLGITDKDVKQEKINKGHLYNSFDKYWLNFDARDSRNWLVNREKVDSAKRVGARLHAFVIDPQMRKFTLGENQFDVPDIINNKKIVIFNLRGFDTDSKIYLGNLITHAVKSYFNYQATKTSKPLFLYVDEFQTFITPFFDEMLSQAAKFKISVNLAHQTHRQIPKDTLNIVLGNCYSMVTFNCGDEEADKMGRNFQLNANTLMNLKNHEAYMKIGNDVHHIMTFPPPKTEHTYFNFLKNAWFPC